MTELFFTQNCDTDTWIALPRKFTTGERVFVFRGYDYGLARDDAHGGFEVICCCEQDSGSDRPFFTVPVGLLRDSEGLMPRGEYQGPGLKQLPDRVKGGVER